MLSVVFFLLAGFPPAEIHLSHAQTKTGKGLSSSQITTNAALLWQRCRTVVELGGGQREGAAEIFQWDNITHIHTQFKSGVTCQTRDFH